VTEVRRAVAAVQTATRRTALIDVPGVLA